MRDIIRQNNCLIITAPVSISKNGYPISLYLDTPILSIQQQPQLCLPYGNVEAVLHPVSCTRLRIYSHYHASNLFLIPVSFVFAYTVYIYVYIDFLLYIYTYFHLTTPSFIWNLPAFPKEFEDVFCHAAAHMEREWDHFENCLDARCKQLWHHHLHETFESKQIGYSTSLTWFIYFNECFLNNLEVQEPLPLPAVNSDSNHWQPRGWKSSNHAENHPREKRKQF